MSWEVEFTDEFGQWWDCLDRDEQDHIDEVVAQLEAKGPMLPFPYSQASKAQNMTICANYASSIKAGRTECFTPSIHVAPRSYS